MNFTLKEPIQYSELKQWFEKTDLPKQLKVKGRNYTNVDLIIETNMTRFEYELQRNKDSIKISRQAEAAHRILTTLYNDLKQTT